MTDYEVDRIKRKLDEEPDVPVYRVARSTLERIVEEWFKLYPPETRDNIESLYDTPIVVGRTTDLDYMHYSLEELHQELEEARALLAEMDGFLGLVVHRDDTDKGWAGELLDKVKRKTRGR